MTNESKKSSPTSTTTSSPQMPEWLLPVMRVSGAVYPILLLLGGLCLLTLVAFIFMKNVHLPFLLNINGALLFFAALGLLTMLLAEYRSVVAGWVGVAVGIALYHAPLLILMLVSYVGVDPTVRLIVQLMQHCKILGIIGVFFSVCSLFLAYFIMLMQRERTRRAARMQYVVDTPAHAEKPSIIPKCWQMSRCRPAVRLTCPNYIDRKTCWKRRSGCFCDKDLANFLISASGKGEAGEVITMQSSAHARPPAAGTRRAWREQKKLCYSCPLFMEHQEYKYRRFGWMSIVLTLIIIGVVYPFYHIAYNSVMTMIDSSLRGRLNLPGIDVETSLANSPFEWVLLAVLGMLLWSYMISLIDAYFLEWKL